MTPAWPCAASVLAFATLAVTGCGGAAGEACPAPTPFTGTSALAGDIRADRLGTVVGAQDIVGLSTLTIVSGRSVADLRERVPRAMQRVGLEVLSEENEGFEAEIYFGRTDGNSTAVARIREDLACDGRTTIQVTVTSDDELSAGLGAGPEPGRRARGL